MLQLGIPHTKSRTKLEIFSSNSFGAIDATMVDMTANDLQTKVKVIHFGTNRFLIHCESKKLGHFYFYCNFGKCWSIF